MREGSLQFGVSYFGVRDPRHVRTDLDEIAAAGFSAVTHTLSEYDLRFHLEDVRRVIDETKARGMEASLDPWGVAGLFGGEAYSELALTDLASRQVDSSGASLPACCPNAAATRDLLVRWAKVAGEMGADLVFWDEPHYYLGAFGGPRPTSGCRCRSCEDAWRAAHGSALPDEDDHRLAAFRRDALARLLEVAIAAAPSCRHSLCLLPQHEFSAAGTDDWSAFASLASLSRLSTDPYWMDRPVDPAEFVRMHCRPLKEWCDRTNREMEVWIQAIRIRAGHEASIEHAVQAAAESGAERIAFWSFRGTDRMSHLTCEDPDAAWAAMKRAVLRRIVA